jgi:cytochrome c-type biogenesis protein CcmH
VTGPRALRRWLPWLALVIVLVVALVVGSIGHHRATDLDSRVRAIAADIRCPVCSGQSAADSQAPESQEIRAIIRQRLQEGQTAGQIKAYVVSRYGEGILLRPETHGVALLVWALPVVAFVAAAGGMAYALSRRRRRAHVAPTDEDRALVEEALRA